MATLLWILIPGLVAAGAALLICFMMRCRLEEAVARERAALEELRSALGAQKEVLAAAICDAKAIAKREAFDDFLNDFRVEQRYYVRTSRLLFLNRKTLVLRERILFRNLPLSRWVEENVTLDESVGAGCFGPALEARWLAGGLE